MTGCAIDFHADRVCIAADSAVYGLDGVHVGYATKLYALPVPRAVFFARGYSGITIGTVQRMSHDPRLHSFEDAVAHVPEHLNGAASVWSKAMGIELEDGGYWGEAVMVGWSVAEERMRAALFVSTDGFTPHSDADRNYGRGIAAIPFLPPEYVPMDRSADPVERKLLLTLQAIDRWAADNPEPAGGQRLGGNVDCVTLTEAQMTMTSIGTIGTAPKQKRKGKR